MTVGVGRSDSRSRSVVDFGIGGDLRTNGTVFWNVTPRILVKIFQLVYVPEEGRSSTLCEILVHF